MGFDREKRPGNDPRHYGRDEETDGPMRDELRAPWPGKRTLVEREYARNASWLLARRTLSEGAADRLGTQRAPLGPAPASPTSAVPTLQVGRSPSQQSAPAPRAHALDSWAGAGKVGKIFQHAATEAFVDRGTNDAFELRTRWTLAEFASYELGTDAVMEVTRTIHIRLAHGAAILIKSRARSCE